VLPGYRRIRSAEDFRVVVRAGSRAASRTLVVHALVCEPSVPARAGFVVGRSVGGSVVRHRVTRQLRHLMAARLLDLPAGTGVVVRALPPSAGASGSELSDDLSSCVRRVMSRLGQDPGTSQMESL
jgi:ribonuclease P protein component